LSRQGFCRVERWEGEDYWTVDDHDVSERDPDMTWVTWPQTPCQSIMLRILSLLITLQLMWIGPAFLPPLLDTLLFPAHAIRRDQERSVLVVLSSTLRRGLGYSIPRPHSSLFLNAT
jgi:hypothetical protein